MRAGTRYRVPAEQVNRPDGRVGHEQCRGENRGEERRLPAAARDLAFDYDLRAERLLRKHPDNDCDEPDREYRREGKLRDRREAATKRRARQIAPREQLEATEEKITRDEKESRERHVGLRDRCVRQIAPREQLEATEEKRPRDEKESRERHVGLRDRCVREHVRVERVERERGDSTGRAVELSGPDINENSQCNGDGDQRQLRVKKYLLRIVVAEDHEAREPVIVLPLLGEPVPVGRAARILDIEGEERQRGKHFRERRVLGISAKVAPFEMGVAGEEVIPFVDRRRLFPKGG